MARRLGLLGLGSREEVTGCSLARMCLRAVHCICICMVVIYIILSYSRGVIAFVCWVLEWVTRQRCAWP